MRDPARERYGVPAGLPVLGVLGGSLGAKVLNDVTARIVADADPDEVEIGLRVRMTFRRLLTANGIHNYFWKATPIR